MTKKVQCTDIGLECDYEARGLTEDDVLTQVAVHAKEDHPDVQLDQEVIARVREEIRDV